VDLRRVRTWEWFTGLAGLVLLVSLFLPWYGVAADGAAAAVVEDAGSASGWEALSVIDIFLALTALLAISHPIVTAAQRTIAVPQALSAFIVWIALFAGILLLIRLLSPPGVESLGGAVGVDGAFLTRSVGGAGASLDDFLSVTREFGAWLATAAVLGIGVGGWRSMRDKRFPRALRPNLRIETIPTPAPGGERSDAVR
jgi:hypothetical protein